jgi:hypothetical protein
MGWVDNTKSSVVQLIYNIVNAVTPTPDPLIIVQRANINAPRPKTDYITVLFPTLAQIGEEQSTRPDENGDILRVSDRDITVSLQCISENAMDILEDLKRDIKSKANLQLLRNAGLAYVDMGDVLDITATLGDNDMESRASLDLFLRTAVSITENVGIIESISGTGTFTNPDGSTIEQDIPVT